MKQRYDPSEMEELLREAEKEGIRRFSVGAGILNDDGALLVLKRKADDSFPGMFEIPGGGVDNGETLSEAVCRETMEETGLTVADILCFCGTFDYQERGRTRQFSFLVTAQSTENITLSEHDEYLWIHSVNGLSCTPEMLQVIETIFKNAVIWKEKRM